MNYIRHLNAFFSFVRQDDRLTSSHVSLYIALFQHWNLNRFQNPFPVNRQEMMKLSKIGSKNTYHKCIKELHDIKYICYHPAKARYQPVCISMIRLDKHLEKMDYRQLDLFSSSPEKGTEQVSNLTATSPNKDTATVPNMGHLLKQENYKQDKQERGTPVEIIFQKNIKLHEEVNKMGGVPNSRLIQKDSNHFPSPLGEGGRRPDGANKPFIAPALPEVEIFFEENKFSVKEAQKFFHHYESNGWLIAGKTPMQNWKSSAQKWMLNTKEFTNQKNSPHELDTNGDKNYSEPL